MLKINKYCKSAALVASFTVSLTACGDDDDGDMDASLDSSSQDAGGDSSDGLEIPATYDFASRFIEGQSGVAYSGQIFRHVLIAELGSYIGRLTADIDGQVITPADGDVLAAMKFYTLYDATTGADVLLTLSTSEDPLQTTFGQVGSANLESRIAGVEAAFSHKDWSTEFAGWGETGSTTPLELVQEWLGQLDGLAANRAGGIIAEDPSGNAITKVYVTAQGQDLQQLLQKFLGMSIAFSQANDKYLDTAVEDAGLLAPNAQDADKAYSKLEHAWDEVFGYFGAARAYGVQTDAENMPSTGIDASDDGKIDFLTEVNFGASTNAAKRDAGSSAAAPTDYTQDAFNALLRGRAIIRAAGDTLTADELEALKLERDRLTSAWEKAIAATIVHYINATIQDMDAFESDSYVFLDHAKHWSEAKGFALGLQFNPFSPLSDADLLTLHAKLGDAPVLPNADAGEITTYRAGLLAARALLAETYGFSSENVGDANGENGW